MNLIKENLKGVLSNGNTYEVQVKVIRTEHYNILPYSAIDVNVFEGNKKPQYFNDVFLPGKIKEVFSELMLEVEDRYSIKLVKGIRQYLKTA